MWSPITRSTTSSAPGAARADSSTRSSGGIGQWPQAFCHRESGWQTTFKGLATYTVPKIDVLFSGTFRSVPYAGSEFPSVQSQSLGAQALALNIPGVVNETSLNRPFGSGQVVQFLQHRRTRHGLRRSSERRGSSLWQDLEVRQDEDAVEPRRVQPVQLEHDRGVPAELRARRISIRCRSCRRASSRSARSSTSRAVAGRRVGR